MKTKMTMTKTLAAVCLCIMTAAAVAEMTITTDFVPNSTASLLQQYDLAYLQNQDDVALTVPTNTSILVYNEQDDVYIANVPIFVPLTIDGNIGPGIDDAMAAILAIHQWHHYLATSQSDCRIRLSPQLIDTAMSPIQATQKLNQLLKYSDFPVAAILGAYSSAVTSPLAVLSGLQGIPQISHASTADGLDVKEQYPLLARTVPASSGGEAAAAVSYLRRFVGTTHLAILFVSTDAFGSSLEKQVTQLASELHISTQAVVVSEIDQDSLLESMMRLKESDVKHVFAICGEQQLEAWLEAADIAGLLKEDYFWFFPGLDIDSLLRKLRNMPEESRLPKLLNGAGILQIQGGYSPDTIYVEQENAEAVSPATPEHLSGHNFFLGAWNQAQQDSEFIKYLEEKLGVSSSGLSNRPHSVRPFMFDAVVTLGKALSGAERIANETESITGPQVYDYFINTMQFQDGASGTVEISNETGSRVSGRSPVEYAVYNIVEQKQSLSFIPTSHYNEGSWKAIEDRSFRFRNGSPVPPDPLGSVEVDNHLISTASRAVGYSLSGISIIALLFACFWILFKQTNPVIRRSNPLFLYTLSAGAQSMSVAIIFVGMDEKTTTNQTVLDASCMAGPYFYFGGLSLMMGPLLAKTMSLHKAFLNPKQQYLELSSRTTLLVSGVVLATNLLILVVWNVLSPLEWNRNFSGSQDRYGRSIESFGSCQSDQSSVFYGTLFAVNAVLAIGGISLSFITRNIETEYSESVYIAIAQAGILQSWCIGLPLLAATWDDPEGRFLVEAVVIFLTSMGVLLLIFVPKVQAVRNKNNGTNASFSATSQRSQLRSQNRVEQSRQSSGFNSEVEYDHPEQLLREKPASLAMTHDSSAEFLSTSQAETPSSQTERIEQ